MMEIVWPSAGRALELLRGSKFNLEESELVALSNHPVRHKRSADHFIETTPSDRIRTLENMDYTYLDPRGSSFPPYSAQGVGVYGSSVPPIHLDAQMSSSSQNYHPSSSSSWASSDNSSTTTAFQGTLSTSVLPQIYSTGLVDDRVGGSNNTRVHSQSSQSDSQNRSGGGGGGTARYPQYWHDYSTFPQLGTAYVGYQDPNAGSIGVSVSQQQQQQQQQHQQHQHQHQHQQHQHQQQQSAPSQQLYLSEHYNMYS
jgi:hypothetical protein